MPEDKIVAEVKIDREFSFTNLAGFSREINGLNQEETTATELLEVILGGGLLLGSSDIHFEPTKEEVRLRFRLDGLLYDASFLSHKVYSYVSNRIKLLSGLKINVRDAAQDGRFTITDETNVEVRTSTNPSEFGETIVLRILDPRTISLNLEDLGLRADDREMVMEELKKPNGMLLVTGPTGSGKTTTLYAFLKKIVNSEIKIITIEDPIEYHLSGIEQTQVDPAAGYDFENGLRSILRQDPDVLLVGEIRDLETADIALDAALTGHLVFSTLHTNDALGAVPRLIELGAKPQIIGPALNLVIAQRLLRRLCENCRERIDISSEIRAKIDSLLKELPPKITKEKYFSPVVYKARGCEKCDNAGYKGRLGIYELFRLTRDFEPLLVEEVTELAIEKMALKKGFVPLQVDGILKVLEGITSFDEVERASGPLSWSLTKE
jgi:type II secretory ATPase GspE/PulE/Tfp pilus assembly ATPase PilB-like protein